MSYRRAWPSGSLRKRPWRPNRSNSSRPLASARSTRRWTGSSYMRKSMVVTRRWRSIECHRRWFPARPRNGSRIPPRPRRDRRSALASVTADRSEPGLLGHGPAARRQSTIAPRSELLHHGHHDVRTRTDIPYGYGIRTGPNHRGRVGRPIEIYSPVS